MARNYAKRSYSNRFIYSRKIYDYSKEIGAKIDEYKVILNSEQLFKEYRADLYEASGNFKKKYDEIRDIHCHCFINAKKEPIGWIWFGVSSFDKQIPEKYNPMRGLRLRKENIQIGSSETLIKLFKEQRGNFYFIGEVHATHPDLIPNGRRDYFNENRCRIEFERMLKEYFAEELHKLYYYANQYKNTLIKTGKYAEKKVIYEQKTKSGFVDKNEQKKVQEELETAKEESRKAKKDLVKLESKRELSCLIDRVSDIIAEKYLQVDDGEEQKDCRQKKDGKKTESSGEKASYLVDDLAQYSRSERKLISRIMSIIANTLTPDMSTPLIQKIHEELKSNEKSSIN